MIDGQTFKNQTQLSQLYVTDFYFGFSHLFAFSTLSSNSISMLNSSSFAGLTSLTILSVKFFLYIFFTTIHSHRALDHNPLTELVDGIFQSLTSLTQLYLDNTGIRLLRNITFTELPLLTYLYAFYPVML